MLKPYTNIYNLQGILTLLSLMSKLLGLLSDDEIYVTFIPKQISRHGKYYQGLCHMGLEIGLCPPGNLQPLWKNLHFPSKFLAVTS